MQKIGKIGDISNDIVERNIFFIKEKLDEIIDHENELIDFIQSLLDEKEREGYQNCMDDIWEKARGLRSWTEHDGSVSAGDIEAGLREAYLEIEEELSKLTTK